MRRQLTLVLQLFDGSKTKKGHLWAMFQPCSKFKERSNKPEFNSLMMTRWVVSGCGWQRRKESDDMLHYAIAELDHSQAELVPSVARRWP